MIWLLTMPLVIAVVATATNRLAFKMAVPLLCAAIIALFTASRVAGDAPTTVVATAIAVIAALVVSAAGDYFLSRKGNSESYFIVGIALYLLAHAGYLTAAWMNATLRVPGLVVVLVVFVAYYVVMLRPAIPSAQLSAAVLVYLLLSCVVLAVSFGLVWDALPSALFIAGIALIVVSDTAISVKEFLDRRWADPIILPTYYVAHLAITAALLLR
ncbi:MAG: hypothetical protein EA382_12790 [Spirochaetaceae bacterium]|nr:MAG: hypothetical protein EA382_12790 [Spirochaetaceae bacterium]